MRIVIDMQGAQGEHATHGIGRYVKDYARGMINKKDSHEIFLLINA